MPKYLDKDGLEEFFDDIKDLVHGPSYLQVSNWMDAHPDVLSSAIATDVADATDNWLDEHPEAINAVQDGSISFDKLADAARKGYMRNFETVEQMQRATDLKAGMTCHTNGFYASGDGGAAYYTVSASGTANDMDVLALQGGLFATLIVTKPYVTPEMFGAHGDGTYDDSDSLLVCFSKNLPVSFITGKTYGVTKTITGSMPSLNGNGATILILSQMDNLSVMSLTGTHLVTDITLDSNNMNFMYGLNVIRSNSIEVSHINVSDVYDKNSDYNTSLVHVAYCGNVYIHDININNCKKLGDGTIANTGGAITGVQVLHHVGACVIQNVMVQELHNVDANGLIIMEDAQSIHVGRSDTGENTTVIISGAYIVNGGKRAIKTQVAGHVSIDGAYIYQDVANELVTLIGIQTPNDATEPEIVKGEISNCYLVNKTSDNMYAYCIASTELCKVYNCTIESPTAFAFAVNGKLTVTDTNIIGKAFSAATGGKSLIAANIVHQGGVFFADPQGIIDYVSIRDCQSVITGSSAENTYDAFHLASAYFEITNLKASKYAKFRYNGTGTFIAKNVFIQNNMHQDVFVLSNGQCTIEDLEVTTDPSITSNFGRMVNTSSGATVKLKNISFDNKYTWLIVGSASSVDVLGNVPIGKLYCDSFGSIVNTPDWLSQAPSISHASDGLLYLSKTDGKLYRSSSNTWVAIN